MIPNMSRKSLLLCNESIQYWHDSIPHITGSRMIPNTPMPHHIWPRSKLYSGLAKSPFIRIWLVLGRGPCPWAVDLGPWHGFRAVVVFTSTRIKTSPTAQVPRIRGTGYIVNVVFTPYDHVKVSSIAKLRGMVHGSKFAIFMTILMGAFVAGLDAGLVYNSWPKYGENWMPVELTKEAKFHPTDFFNDPACAQFMHRNLAYFTLVMVTLTWLKGRKMALGPRAKLALHSTMLMAIAQASLGIVTLLHYVPTSLASIHQNGALILASAIIWLANEIRRIPK